jgi:hypothetical protein
MNGGTGRELFFQDAGNNGKNPLFSGGYPAARVSAVPVRSL